MKIAIIGGGFYGCYFAKKLKEKFKNKVKIEIFEKNNDLLTEAGKNNQYRLHKGFHYPRSTNTIKQTIEGSKIFVKEFRSFIDIPKENIYLIHKKSKINFKNYLKIFNKYKIKYKILNLKKIPYIKNYNDFQGAINTNEGVILIDKLLPYLKKKIKSNCKIFKNNKIIDIDEKKGNLLSEKKKNYENFDHIINTTYTEPNIGNRILYKTKYELAALVKVKNPYKKKLGITIMDGPFVSLYPCNKSYSSFSSVKYTPIKKFKNIKSLRAYQTKFNYEMKMKIKNKILNHAKIFLKLNLNFKIKPKLIISPKTKLLDDYNDQRTTNYKINGKIISVMCGKLDAAPIIWKRISKLIN